MSFPLTKTQTRFIDVWIWKLPATVLAGGLGLHFKTIAARKLQLLAARGLKFCPECHYKIIPTKARACEECLDDGPSKESDGLSPLIAAKAREVREKGFDAGDGKHPPWDERTEQSRCNEVYRTHPVVFTEIPVSDLPLSQSAEADPVWWEVTRGKRWK